jgi:prepilin-type N-terminal cleavage/methylation domain-containing protein
MKTKNVLRKVASFTLIELLVVTAAAPTLVA